MRRRVLVLALLIGPVLLCAGLDRLALRHARQERMGPATHPKTEAPSTSPTPASPEPSSTASPVSPPARPEPSLPAQIFDATKSAVFLYGECRDIGSWPLKLQRQRAAEQLEREDLSADERASAEGELRVADQLLGGGDLVSWIFLTCGTPGPDEPPPDLQ